MFDHGKVPIATGPAGPVARFLINGGLFAILVVGPIAVFGAIGVPISALVGSMFVFAFVAGGGVDDFMISLRRVPPGPLRRSYAWLRRGGFSRLLALAVAIAVILAIVLDVIAIVGMRRH